jgi:hypothetical protein
MRKLRKFLLNVIMLSEIIIVFFMIILIWNLVSSSVMTHSFEWFFFKRSLIKSFILSFPETKLINKIWLIQEIYLKRIITEIILIIETEFTQDESDYVKECEIVLCFKRLMIVLSFSWNSLKWMSQLFNLFLTSFIAFYKIRLFSVNWLTCSETWSIRSEERIKSSISSFTAMNQMWVHF